MVSISIEHFIYSSLSSETSALMTMPGCATSFNNVEQNFTTMFYEKSERLNGFSFSKEHD